jgi:hypothetical protein
VECGSPWLDCPCGGIKRRGRSFFLGSGADIPHSRGHFARFTGISCLCCSGYRRRFRIAAVCEDSWLPAACAATPARVGPDASTRTCRRPGRRDRLLRAYAGHGCRLSGDRSGHALAVCLANPVTACSVQDYCHHSVLFQWHSGRHVRSNSLHRSHAWRGCRLFRKDPLPSAHRLDRLLRAGRHGSSFRRISPRSAHLRFHGTGGQWQLLHHHSRDPGQYHRLPHLARIAAHSDLRTVNSSRRSLPSFHGGIARRKQPSPRGCHATGHRSCSTRHGDHREYREIARTVRRQQNYASCTNPVQRWSLVRGEERGVGGALCGGNRRCRRRKSRCSSRSTLSRGVARSGADPRSLPRSSALQRAAALSAMAVATHH